MGYGIQEIEGIGPAFSEKLATANIATTEDLLNLCCTPKGRKEVAAKTELSEAQLLKWTNLADLKLCRRPQHYHPAISWLVCH